MSETNENIVSIEDLDLSYGYIYRFINLINGKMYHGQTTGKKGKREQKHLKNAERGEKSYFYNALRKYGKEDFKNNILCYCGDKLSLGFMEDFCINLFSLFPKGYNLRRGGIHGKLSKIMKEFLKKALKEKWSETSKEVWKKPGFREKRNETIKEQAKNKVKCRYCEKEYVYKILKENHEKYCKKNPNRIIEKCQYCERICSSLSLKISHEKYCKENQNKQVEKCPYCKKEYSYRGLGMHKKTCEKKLKTKTKRERN